MLLSYGPFFFAFNYPTPWRGWGESRLLARGAFLFLCLIISGLSARTK